MTDDRYSKKRHPIRVVSRRTGLSRDVLRAWELRYDAVEPERTPGGQRLYSDADIERLRLLQRAVDAGRRIGQVADLATPALEGLVMEDAWEAPSSSIGGNGSRPGRQRAAGYLSACLEAVKAMDGPRLESLLTRAAISLNATDLIAHVVAPFMTQIGDLWWEGRLTPGHERMATTIVRRILDEIRISMQNAGAPGLVVATPANQRHEIGAMLAAAAAAAAGWQVTYLGADLPATSIAQAVEMTRSRAVALSLIYPEDDASLADELRALRRMLPSGVAILVGGQGTRAYQGVVEEIGAIWLPDAPSLRSALDLVQTAASGIDWYGDTREGGQ